MSSLPAEKAQARPEVVRPTFELGTWVWSAGPVTFDRRDFELPNWGQRPSLRMSAKLAELGYCVKDGVIERLPEEKSWGAFEPFSYTERS